MKTIIPSLAYQGETNECGLACISMMCETQGVHVSLESLRERYPASANGTSLKTLCNIMTELALPTYPVLFEHEELGELPLPAILHYGANHYVLLVYRKGNYLCVMNPAIGQQLLPADTLKQDISGYALILENNNLGITPDQAAEKKRSQFAFLDCMSLKETAKMRGIYPLMLLAFLVSLTLFIMPVMVSNSINEVFSSAGKYDFPYFYYFLTFFISTALAFSVRWITEKYVKRFVVINSIAGFSRLLSNTTNFIDKRSPGEIFSRFANWQMASTSKVELDNGLRTDWIVGAIALLVMSYMSPLLATVSAMSVTVMGIVSVWAIYRDRYYTQLLQVKTAEQSDFLMESIQGFSTIKSARLDNQRKTVFARYALSLFISYQQQRVYEQVKTSLYQLISSLEMVFFMLLALPLLTSGKLSLGEFFAYSFVREIFTSYITKIFYAILKKNNLHVIDTRARDLFPTVNAEADTSVNGISEAEPAFISALSFHHLIFAYDAQSPVLRDLSLTLNPSQSIAIVGESGTGKSTLLKVISGLIAPQHGTIEIDGHQQEHSQICRFFFMQSQEDILFNTSVLQNITLFDEYVDEKQYQVVKRHLASLGMSAVVDRLPGGMNALIRESHTGLSLGQRQRLLLARAMYSSCPIMVLDEPTANLDEETARLVITALLTHCRENNKTLVTVTHSESVLMMFDQVYRMNDGRLEKVSQSLISHQTLTAEDA